MEDGGETVQTINEIFPIQHSPILCEPEILEDRPSHLPVIYKKRNNMWLCNKNFGNVQEIPHPNHETGPSVESFKAWICVFTASRIPLTKEGDSSLPYRFAISTASLIAT